MNLLRAPISRLRLSAALPCAGPLLGATPDRVRGRLSGRSRRFLHSVFVANQSRAGGGGVDGGQPRSNDSPSNASSANDASQCVPT